MAQQSGNKKAPERDKALEQAIAQIDKQYGKGSVMRLGDEGRVPIEVIPPGRSPSTWRWASEGCHAGGSWRSRPGVQR